MRVCSETCSKLMIPCSTQEEIKASEGRNIPSITGRNGTFAVHWGNCSNHNSAATKTLKSKLKRAKPNVE